MGQFLRNQQNNVANYVHLKLITVKLITAYKRYFKLLINISM